MEGASDKYQLGFEFGQEKHGGFSLLLMMTMEKAGRMFRVSGNGSMESYA